MCHLMASFNKNLRNNLQIKNQGIQSEILSFLRKPAVYHGLFWSLYFILNVVRWGSYYQDYWNAFVGNLIEFPMHIWLAYANIYFLIPRFLPKKYLRYILFISIGIILAVAGRLFLETFLQFDFGDTSTRYQYILDLLIGEVYVQGFITALKLLLDWGKSQKRMRRLEKSNFETELDFLRSQVQPHFFFNTLNNLYSLTLDKSDLAPETVLKLSELMSYVIYDGKQKKVHLSKEISYIQNYLDLEKLRFGNKLKTRLEINGQVDNQEMAPLLLLPFIENSFKHGVGDGIDDININIELEVNQDDIVFMVQNRKHEHLTAPAPNPYHHIGYNGVGIENIKRRLELIYGNNYHLEIKDDKDNFTVTLKIPTYENTLSNS